MAIRSDFERPVCSEHSDFSEFPESPLISFENNRKAHGEIHPAHTHPHPQGYLTSTPRSNILQFIVR